MNIHHLCAVRHAHTVSGHCRYRAVENSRNTREQSSTVFRSSGTGLIPQAERLKMFTPHPLMTCDEIHERIQHVLK